MFLGTISNYVSTANANIPITTAINTNNKIFNNTTENTIEIKKSGYYNVDGYLNVTGGTTANVTATVYANGVARATTPSVTLTAATDIAALPIVDAIKVVMAEYPNLANISVRLNTTGITVNGNIRIAYIQ